MIRYTDISFKFSGKIILENFNCEIKEGEHCALMGESGCGKTTLMNSLMGLSTPEKGKIYIAGKELSHSNIQSIRGMIAWVPQELQLPYETVREVIKAPFSLKINNNQTFDENRYINLLFELGVDGKKIIDKSLREISGGERQRVMIALAVLLNKKILLLDEPTSAVDIYTREKIISFIKKLQATVMIVTHDEQLAGSCNQVIRLKKN